MYIFSFWLNSNLLRMCISVLVAVTTDIYRIYVIELILVFAVVWKWKVVESELRRKNVQKFHPGIALRVYLRHTCANCIALKPRAVWITRFAKVNFVFQFDCNRGSSVYARVGTQIAVCTVEVTSLSRNLISAR